ncbi:hypothetical protein KFK09_027878 [Dendrobium nobile]|uniref:Uncharacterized protein n=1 Tax=Dendrobium nobile TaxID=94219 RepID=A0A8T3A0M3_DENNO|nr:hypothetical protein KFK09_027878 [Dendrobium nobile]
MEEFYRTVGDFLMFWSCWMQFRVPVPVPVPSVQSAGFDWTMMTLPLQTPWTIFGQPGLFDFYHYSESSLLRLGSWFS